MAESDEATPAERGPDGVVNRRADERLVILGDLSAEVTIRQPMEIVEISPAGLQVITNFPFQLESLHEIRLTLGVHTLVVKGRITYCQIADVNQESVRYRSGVAHTDLTEAGRAAIVEFVEALKDERRAQAPGGAATSD